jgi:hypothetical protein
VAEGAADEGAPKAGVAATHGLLHAEPSADDRYPEPEVSSSGFEGRHSGEAIGEKRSYDEAIGSVALVPLMPLMIESSGLVVTPVIVIESPGR